MNKFNEVSDFEINKAVARGEGLYILPLTQSSDSAGVKCMEDEDLHISNHFSMDYCNNPSDAWPLIVANKICVMDAYGEKWNAFHWADAEGRPKGVMLDCTDANPLRAAMIVYLMMQESNDE